jgi:hypothetical protein
MAAKWPPSVWSDQYGSLWSGSISQRRTGSVFNTAQPAGTLDGATQSSPNAPPRIRTAPRDAPLRVNQ